MTVPSQPADGPPGAECVSVEGNALSLLTGGPARLTALLALIALATLLAMTRLRPRRDGS